MYYQDFTPIKQVPELTHGKNGIVVISPAPPLQITLTFAVAVVVWEASIATERVATETEVAILDAGKLVVLVSALAYARFRSCCVTRETFGQVTEWSHVFETSLVICSAKMNVVSSSRRYCLTTLPYSELACIMFK